MGKLGKKIIGILLVILLFMITAFTGCSKKEVEPISKTEFVLDTYCKVVIYDKSSEEVLNKAFDKLNEINVKMNASNEDSEITNISKKAGIGYVKVSDDTYYVIKKGIEFSQLTGGKFDITVGPLVKLWGIISPNPHVPTEQELKVTLPLIDYKNVLLDDANKSVMLKVKGMSLDLGGIAKGYAADAVSKVLMENGVKHAIIDLGGNVITLGSKVDGSDWKIGIQDPDSTRGDYLGIVSVTNKAVVTSGIYERFFEVDGKRYHHIMDTKTGYPVDNNLASVTIITEESINGDALAKAFCMGLEKGMEFVKQQKGIEAIFVTKDKKVYITPGLANNFIITNASYEIIQ
jgi:thiamine biosynthesis lipoprotein